MASAFDLASVDCLTTAEMIHALALLLENAAEHGHQTQCQRKELGFIICRVLEEEFFVVFLVLRNIPGG